MMRTLLLWMLICLQGPLLFAQYPNVLINDQRAPEEPTICINPFNPAIIVAGSNIDHQYFSADTGRTWQQQVLTSSHGVAGDPCVVVDNTGAFYFLHLANPSTGTWLDRIVCQKSTDHGVRWSDGSFMGINKVGDHDKQWATVDLNNNTIYATWTHFDEYGSTSSNDKSNILFSKSVDGGESWSNAIKINELSGDCIDSDYTTEGAVPTVGPNGEIYVAWSFNDSIYFDRSLDEGQTWLEKDIVAATQPSGWDYTIPGIYRSNGLPITACDTSQSMHRGNLYINWTDQRNGLDDTDVWFCKSSDGGNTWSDAKRVNNDAPGSHQFLTWMTVDQANGNLYFVFYDRRNHSDEHTDVYMALSKDGGETFENFQISDAPFFPREDVFFGDYNNITAYNNIVRPIWTRLNYTAEENGLSVWTALVDLDTIAVNFAEIMNIEEDYVYPNPSDALSFYCFKLKVASNVSLVLMDSYGKVVKQIIKSEMRPAGKYIEQINIKDEALTPGLYFYKLISNKSYKTAKLIVNP